MTDIFSEHTDPSRDLPRQRIVEVAGGTPFLLKQYDPHGFWKIHREHGQVPVHLQGEYTTIKMARQAVYAYIAEQERKKK